MIPLQRDLLWLKKYTDDAIAKVPASNQQGLTLHFLNSISIHLTRINANIEKELTHDYSIPEDPTESPQLSFDFTSA